MVETKEMSVIERAAHAVEILTGSHCDRCESQLPFDGESIARAVLQAIREPSEGMIEAGIASVETCTDNWTASAACAAGHAYQAMIDAALSE